MLIFALDNDPDLSAQAYCDRHVVKTILDTSTILATCVQDLSKYEMPLYSKRYKNHPWAKWGKESYPNLYWLINLTKGLTLEYTFRYKKHHAYEGFLSRYWFHSYHLSTVHFPYAVQTSFPLCMPPEYRENDPIEAYRNYYLGAKGHLLKYTRRTPPIWMQNLELGEHKD